MPGPRFGAFAHVGAELFDDLFKRVRVGIDDVFVLFRRLDKVHYLVESVVERLDHRVLKLDLARTQHVQKVLGMVRDLLDPFKAHDAGAPFEGVRRPKDRVEKLRVVAADVFDVLIDEREVFPGFL